MKTRSNISASDLLRIISTELQHAKASDFAYDDQCATFHVRFFRLVWPWNPLIGIRSGDIQLHTLPQTVQIRYSLCLLPVVGLIVLVLPAIFLILFQAAGVWDSEGLSFSTLLILWIWMALGTYLAVWLRFHYYLRRTLQRSLTKLEEMGC